MILSHDAIAVIASVSSLALCASSSVLFIMVRLVCTKLKSPNQRATADTDSTIEYEMNETSLAHVYEAIVPKTLTNFEESMDKNIAYGPIYAVCK